MGIWKTGCPAALWIASQTPDLATAGMPMRSPGRAMCASRSPSPSAAPGWSSMREKGRDVSPGAVSSTVSARASTPWDAKFSAARRG